MSRVKHPRSDDSPEPSGSARATPAKAARPKRARGRNACKAASHPAARARPAIETIPFYDRTPAARSLRGSMVRLVDAIGLHLICPRQPCRRAHACRDTDMRDRPFCTYHYRGIVRFMIHAMAAKAGVVPDLEADPDETLHPPWRGRPLLAQLLSDADLKGLARPADAGRSPWTQEDEPEAVAFLAELRAAQAAKLAKATGQRPARPRSGVKSGPKSGAKPGPEAGLEPDAPAPASPGREPRPGSR